MSILNSLLADAKKPEIPFGIHGNCKLTGFHRGEKHKNDGTVIKLNGFTTFSLYKGDPKKKKVTHQKEISWFNIDTTNAQAYDNFVTQMQQMEGILSCYYTKKEIGKDFDFFRSSDIDTVEEFEEIFSTPKEVQKVHAQMVDNYFDMIEALLEEGTDKMLRIKMVYSFNGRNLQAPRYGVFVESEDIAVEDTTLMITDREKKGKEQSTAAPKDKNPINTNI